MISALRDIFASFPDSRRGKNKSYSMLDAALGAFSVFFTQSPSFLSHQKAMLEARGRSNARTLFGMGDVPAPEHTRKLLDGVPVAAVPPAFEVVFEAISETGLLDIFKGVNGSRLIVLDGVRTHWSEAIHCPGCTVREHRDGRVSHSHSAVVPAVVSPVDPRAIPLRPEFALPRDGSDKRDCEIDAAKRWLADSADLYASKDTPTTYLGDDLHSHEPFCREVLKRGEHFILTCKESSHPQLCEWVSLLEEGRDILSVSSRVRNRRKHWETRVVRYARGVPLTGGDKALMVNWPELAVRDSDGVETYRNAWITDRDIGEGNALAMAESGRARWSIGNGAFNALKTKGYHPERNFGHGAKHLACLLVAMNVPAFQLHTLLDEGDESYRLIRDALPSGKTFFDHLRALTVYICFPSWSDLMDFMMKGLEIGPYQPPPGKRRGKRAPPS